MFYKLLECLSRTNIIAWLLPADLLSSLWEVSLAPSTGPDVDILLHSLSSRHSVQPNALKVSAALFSHLKVSKALSASSSVVLYRIHTLRCIFSPSKSAHFVPAILEQSFRPPTSATTTSSIVFLDKGEKRWTLLGIIEDLPLAEGWVCLRTRRWRHEFRQLG